MTDLVTRARCLYKREPVAAWLVSRLRDDFNDVAILEFRLQRHHTAVDLRADAGVSDLAVNRIGKIDGCGLARQRYDFSFRCEGVDLFGIEVDLQRAEE